jgi:hypothetical protein
MISTNKNYAHCYKYIQVSGVWNFVCEYCGIKLNIMDKNNPERLCLSDNEKIIKDILE